MPVAGLLAETGLTLCEEEAAALRTLAAAEGEELDGMLVSVDRFCNPRLQRLPEASRRALLARLGMFGVRLSISAFRSGRVTTATELSRLLVEASGLAGLRRVPARSDSRPRSRTRCAG